MSLAAQAEVAKLRRILGVEGEALDYLSDLPEAALRRVREAVSERLFVQDEAVFRRLAWVASRLPVWMTLPLCRALGPMLTARIVGEMPAQRAIATAVRLEADYIASICVHLDPRRARELIHRIPLNTIIAVALAIVARRDFPTIGRFVDFIPDQAIRAALEAITEEADLLQIAFYVDSRNRLDHLVRMLPAERRRRAILLVLDERQDLLNEILCLVTHVSTSLMTELGNLAAAQDEAVIARIIRRTQEQHLWGDLLPVVAALSPEHQRKVANLPILRESPDVLNCLLQATDRHQLWRIVLPLATLLDEPTRTAFALAGARLEPASIRRAAQAVVVGDLWAPMMDLMSRMPFDRQCEFARILKEFSGIDSALDRRVIKLALQHGLRAALEANGLAVAA